MKTGTANDVSSPMIGPPLFLAVFVAMAAASPGMYAGVQLEAAAAPVHVEGEGRWRVALSILNRGDSTAKNVQVTTVSMDSARVVTPLPLKMGEISAGHLGTASLGLRDASGIPGKEYVMKVKGSYWEGERRYPFSLRYALSPFSSSATASSAVSQAIRAEGSRNSNEVRGPAEPPGFAAANPGPARAVPTGPVQPMPKNETAGSDLVPIEVNGLWGYVHSQAPSRLAIRPQFTQAMRFTEGLAAVAIAGKWGYIDASGALRIPAQYNEAAPFAGGVAKVTPANGKQTRYIDSTGAFVPGPSR